MALVNKGWAFVSSSIAATPPGAPTGSVQYNNAGAFAGDSNLTWDGSQLTSTNISASQSVSASAFYFGPDGRQQISDTGTDMSILAASTGMFISADGGNLTLQGQVAIDTAGVLSSSVNISASAFYANGIELTPGGGSGSATVGTTTDTGDTPRYLPFVASAAGVASASILISDAVSLKPGSGSLTLEGEGVQGELQEGFFTTTSSYGSSISLKGSGIGTNPNTEAFINVVSSSFIIPSSTFGPGQPPFDVYREYETLELVAPSDKPGGGNISISGSGDLNISFMNTETSTFGSRLDFGGVEIALYGTESAMADVFSITNGTIEGASPYALLDFNQSQWYFGDGGTSGSIQKFTTDLTGTFNAGLVVNNDSGTMNQGLRINGSGLASLISNVTASFNNDALFTGAFTSLNSNTVRIDGVADNENQPPLNRNLYVSSSIGNGVVTERWTNIAETTAGNGLTASSGVMTIEITGSSLGLDGDGLRVHLGNLSGLAISGSVPGPGGLIISGSNLLDGALGTSDWFDNTIMYVDLDDSSALPYHLMKKTSFATLVGKMAGSNLTAINGVLAASGGGGGVFTDLGGGMAYTTSSVSIGTNGAPLATLYVSSSMADAALLDIQAPGVGTVLFATGSGRVGIGTTNPDHELTVVGSISASTDISASAFYGDEIHGALVYQDFTTVTTDSYTASAPYTNIYRMRTSAGAVGNMEVLLPPISGVSTLDGLTLSFKDTDGDGAAHNIVLRASPGDDIHNASSVTILNDWGSNTIVADATAARWYVMSKS